MTTAFVLSGGGSLGAVQVGMLQALAEYDVHPDVLVGTSAGGLNAAWVAARSSLQPRLRASGNKTTCAPARAASAMRVAARCRFSSGAPGVTRI